MFTANDSFEIKWDDFAHSRRMKNWIYTMGLFGRMATKGTVKTVRASMPNATNEKLISHLEKVGELLRNSDDAENDLELVKLRLDIYEELKSRDVFPYNQPEDMKPTPAEGVENSSPEEEIEIANRLVKEIQAGNPTGPLLTAAQISKVYLKQMKAEDLSFLDFLDTLKVTDFLEAKDYLSLTIEVFTEDAKEENDDEKLTDAVLAGALLSLTIEACVDPERYNHPAYEVMRKFITIGENVWEEHLET